MKNFKNHLKKLNNLMDENSLLISNLNLKKVQFINEVKIHNEIQNHKKILIFDLRSQKEFSESSLPYSLNIPFKDYSENFFKNFSKNILNFQLNGKEDDLKEMILKYKRFYIAIIFDRKKFHRKEILNFSEEKFKEEESLYKALLLYNSLTSNKVREIGLFIKGYEKLKSKFWFILKGGIESFEIKK